VAELFQKVSSLKHAKLGFELLNGTSDEQAKKVAAFPNEHVLNVFVETTSRQDIRETGKDGGRRGTSWRGDEQ
jgi:hypothetical protein